MWRNFHLRRVIFSRGEACPYALNPNYFLIEAGYNLVEVNPFRASQFRKAQGEKAKSDKIDARIIAAILSLGDHKPLPVPDPMLDNLKEIIRFRADLVDEKATMIIHLREALSVLFWNAIIITGHTWDWE